jgi:hypothetical protein
MISFHLLFHLHEINNSMYFVKMKNFNILLFIALVLAFGANGTTISDLSSTAGPVSYDGYKLIDIQLTSPKHLDLLQRLESNPDV